ncbi:hypothetical protein H4I95_05686 [Botrytis cinerea]
MDEGLKTAITTVREFREYVRGLKIYEVPQRIGTMALKNGMDYDMVFDECAKSWLGGKKSPADMDFYRRKLDRQLQIQQLISGAIWNVSEEHELKCREILKAKPDEASWCPKEFELYKSELKYLKETPYNTLLIKEQAKNWAKFPRNLEEIQWGVSEELHRYTLTPAEELALSRLPLHPGVLEGTILDNMRAEFELEFGHSVFEDKPEDADAKVGDGDGVGKAPSPYQLTVSSRSFILPSKDFDYGVAGPFVDAILQQDSTS